MKLEEVKSLFRLWTKKSAPLVIDEVAVTRVLQEKRPARKCPFLYPLVQSGLNGLPIHVFYDCIRQECQIWDGENCSLHQDRRT